MKQMYVIMKTSEAERFGIIPPDTVRKKSPSGDEVLLLADDLNKSTEKLQVTPVTGQEAFNKTRNWNN